MGLCVPKYSIPPVPSPRRPHPEAKEALNVGITHLTYLEGYFDEHCGVWADPPEKLPYLPADQRKSNLWLWLRKNDISRINDRDKVEACARVDLENFDRVEKKNGIGRVLYSAVFPAQRANARITEQIVLGHKEEIAADERFSKYFNPERLYTPHDHTATRGESIRFCRNLDTSYLTKYTVSLRVDFQVGDLDRGEALFSGGKPLFLEITVTGVVATSYYEEKEFYKAEIELRKKEVNYFDAHYRLFSGEKVIAEWDVQGDHYKWFPSFDVDCPFFTAKSSWPRYARVVTKPESEMDSALALLIAHMVCLKFSVVEADRYFRVETPACPPLKAE